MYELNIEIKRDSATFRQLAIGFYGSDDLPPTFEKAAENLDIDFFIKHAIPKDVKISKDGRFYRKKDALATARNLAIYMYGGGMFLRAKGQPTMQGIIVRAKKGK